MLTFISLFLLPYNLGVLVTEQDFVVLGVARTQNQKMILDSMPFSLRTKQKAMGTDLRRIMTW